MRLSHSYERANITGMRSISRSNLSFNVACTIKMKRIIVIDYGLGNLRSATRGLERAGAHVLVTSDPAEYDRADGLVLPGVGAFKSGMQNMQGKKKALYEAVEEGTPVLGICLGMQMLLTTSEEGQHEGGPTDGLDLLRGRVKRFEVDRAPTRLKVPHMGWNRIQITQENALVRGVGGAYVYFVHSYYTEAGYHTIATSEYGIPFAAVVASDNVFGTQFHPEKSSAAGLRILRNFVELC